MRSKPGFHFAASLRKFATEKLGLNKPGHGAAYWFSLIIAISVALIGLAALLTLLTKYIFPLGWAGLTWPLVAVIITPWAVAIAAAFSAYLSAKGQSTRGIIILLFVFLVAIILMGLFSRGLGIVLAVLAFVVTAGIASRTLPERYINRFILAGAFVAAIVFAYDILQPAGQVIVSAEMRIVINVIAMVVAAIYLVVFFRQYPSLPLLNKLIIPFLVLAIIIIGGLTAFNYFNSRRALTQAANQSLLSAASQTSTSINAYLETILNTIELEARLTAFIEYLDIPPDLRGVSHQQIEAIALMRNLQSRGTILSYSLLDPSGIVLLDTRAPKGIVVDLPTAATEYPPHLRLDTSDPGYLNALTLTTDPYLSPAIFDDTSSAGYMAPEPTLYFVGKVVDNAGLIKGFLVARYTLSAIQSIVAQSSALAGEGSFAVLLDENHMRLANGIAPQAQYKFITYPQTEHLIDLMDKRRFPPFKTSLNISNVASNYPDFETGMANLQVSPYFSTLEIGATADLNYAAAITMPRQGWIVAYMQPESILLAPVNRQTQNSVLIAFLAAALTILASWFVAHMLTRPIVRLTAVAQRVAAGDLTIQAPQDTKDEIGLLGVSFNEMTLQLRQTLADLENRVDIRTQELQTASQQLEQRALQLQAVAEVARAIASVRDTERLLPLITRTISDYFDFYHVGIFLLDNSREYAVLRAANSEGGQHMLARGHRLKVGQVGIIGNVTATGQARLALDVGEDAVFFQNPDLPETRSEVGLPLVVGGQIIGALDVQSRQQSAFSDEDVSLLGALADQVAIAIENARLFAETRTTLQELQASQGEYLRQQWASQVAGRSTIGYNIRLGQISPLQTSPGVLSGEVSDAATPVASAIPITLRGQVIGMINLQESLDQRDRDVPIASVWNPEQISFARAVADQVGLALENARLLEESQRRAERESLVSQITTRLRATNDPQAILQTALVELRQALNASRAQVILPRARPEPSQPAPADAPADDIPPTDNSAGYSRAGYNREQE